MCPPLAPVLWAIHRPGEPFYFAILSFAAGPGRSPYSCGVDVGIDLAEVYKLPIFGSAIRQLSEGRLLNPKPESIADYKLTAVGAGASTESPFLALGRRKGSAARGPLLG